MQFTVISVFALVALVAASPVAELESRTPACTNNNSNNGGNTYCCNNNSKVFGSPTKGFNKIDLMTLLNLGPKSCSPLVHIGDTWYAHSAIPSVRIMQQS